MVGHLWKSWLGQAEQDGRAIVRIAGVRYERQLVRIKSGTGLEALTTLMNDKYGSAATPAVIDSGDLWLFEAAPRMTEGAQ